MGPISSSFKFQPRREFMLYTIFFHIKNPTRFPISAKQNFFESLYPFPPPNFIFILSLNASTPLSSLPNGVPLPSM